MVYRSVKSQFLEFTLALVLPGFSIHIFVNSSFAEQFEAWKSDLQSIQNQMSRQHDEATTTQGDSQCSGRGSPWCESILHSLTVAMIPVLCGVRPAYLVDNCFVPENDLEALVKTLQSVCSY